MTLVPQVSVEMDQVSTVLLVRAYLSAQRIMPDVPIDVTVSPSGVGFHIKIHKQVTIEEDLKIRALLWDDPYRLYYALKKWALNPREKYIDLIFDEKRGSKETPLDLEGILRPYKAEVNQINEAVHRGDTDRAEEITQKLAKDIEPQIQPFKRRQYVGCIAFKGDDRREQLEKICGDIMQRDPTFKWRIYPCWFPEFDWILGVFSDDKAQAWKRITWLKNRAKVDNKLILKDAETRLFVKERIAT